MSRSKPIVTKKPAKGAVAAPPARKGGGKPDLAPTGESKAARILAALKKPDGASLADLMGASGWQAHSVRGFLSGTVKKRLGLKLSVDGPIGAKRYRLPA